MEHYEALNEVLVNLFREVQSLEEKALTSSEFRNISGKDIHILEAVGMGEPRSMSQVAASLSVTVGTLTIAVNSLVKKGYVCRRRSQQDRRMVLLSLDERGKAAYLHHQRFHRELIRSVTERLTEEEMDALVSALQKIGRFFREASQE